MQQQQILGSFVYYLEGVSYGNLFISALGPTQALILWGGLPHLRQNLEVCPLHNNNSSNSSSSRVFDLQMGDNLQLEMNNWCKIIFKHLILVAYKFLGIMDETIYLFHNHIEYCRWPMKLVQWNNKSLKQVLGNLNSSARLMT